MHDLKKLPKWAQERIEQAETSRPTTKTGANIESVHIENNAVKHDENSSAAIQSVADALGKNADALKELARSLSGSNATAEIGNGIYLSDVRADNEGH